MDWLRVAVAAWGIAFVLNAVSSVLLIGSERKPTTPAGAGCGVAISLLMLVMTLLVWQRLGGG